MTDYHEILKDHIDHTGITAEQVSQAIDDFDNMNNMFNLHQELFRSSLTVSRLALEEFEAAPKIPLTNNK